MQEGKEQVPSYPRPWYYRPEYMIPMFIFWPSGALLAIRSPWNTNVMFGGVAWMFIIVFGILGIRWLSDGIYQPIVTFYVPGVLLTLITQVQWAAHQKRMVGSQNEGLSDEDPVEIDTSSPPRPSARRRRRPPRTGRPRN